MIKQQVNKIKNNIYKKVQYLNKEMIFELEFKQIVVTATEIK